MRRWSCIDCCRLFRKSHLPPYTWPISKPNNFSTQGDIQALQNLHNQPRTVRDFRHSTRTRAPSCIIFPHDASHLNFKHSIIQLLPTFLGFEFENPYLNWREFEEVYNSCTDQNYNMNIFKLKFFPFSLKEKAKIWLQYLRS